MEVGTHDLIWMQKGGCFAHDENFAAVWIYGDGLRKIILTCTIQAKMPGEPMSAVTRFNLLQEDVECV